MWGKLPFNNKCPRGDCLYYDRDQAADPCHTCTGNRHHLDASSGYYKSSIAKIEIDIERKTNKDKEEGNT